jgi:soluble lytic murein transglycosylase
MIIWDAYAHGKPEVAAPWLDKALAAGGSFSPVDQSRLAYWKGRVQMDGGDRPAALATWQDLQARWPYGYYSALAALESSGGRLTLKNGEAGAADPSDPPVPVVSALWKVEPFPQALFLLAVGEPDLAVNLLRDTLSRPLPKGTVEEASGLFNYLERYHLQLRLYANNLLDDLRRSTVEAGPFWWRAFPRPHWDVVRQEALRNQIDPYFVLAVMREESRFFTSADSSAGAKGLMQIMPSTARMVARNHGLAYEEEHLQRPETNISLGMLYLKRVLKRFSDNPVYAAAAYNAGPGAVQRWLQRYGSLPLDVFVEQIPYEETQNYVKRVFLSFAVYSKLYR